MVPTRSVRRQFLTEYVKSYSHHRGLPESSQPDIVDQLCRDVDRYRGIPGLYWFVSPSSCLARQLTREQGHLGSHPGSNLTNRLRLRLVRRTPSRRILCLASRSGGDSRPGGRGDASSRATLGSRSLILLPHILSTHNTIHTPYPTYLPTLLYNPHTDTKHTPYRVYRPRCD